MSNKFERLSAALDALQALTMGDLSSVSIADLNTVYNITLLLESEVAKEGDKIRATLEHESGVPVGLSHTEYMLLKKGEFVQAIKAIRCRTDMSLKDAKEYAEQFSYWYALPSKAVNHGITRDIARQYSTAAYPERDRFGHPIDRIADRYRS